MITGNICDCEKYYCVNENFKEAFEFLKTLTKDSELGSREIGSLRGCVSEIQTSDKGKDGEDKVFEAHRKYIDIHYVVDGGENLGYANVNALEPKTEYHDDEDYLFLTGHINKITLKSGDFCIAFPEDAHIPAMDYENGATVKRAIVKIKL